MLATFSAFISGRTAIPDISMVPFCSSGLLHIPADWLKLNPNQFFRMKLQQVNIKACILAILFKTHGYKGIVKTNSNTLFDIYPSYPSFGSFQPFEYKLLKKSWDVSIFQKQFLLVIGTSTWAQPHLVILANCKSWVTTPASSQVSYFARSILQFPSAIPDPEQKLVHRATISNNYFHAPRTHAAFWLNQIVRRISICAPKVLTVLKTSRSAQPHPSPHEER